jgi:hypothetical protein
MQFTSEVEWRVSRRGLVVAGPGGDAVLVDHPRAGELPRFLADDPAADVLAARLGPPNAAPLVAEMAEAGFLDGRPEPRHLRVPRVVVTRSGIEIAGIDRPARWIARHVLPVLATWPARIALALIVAAGVWSLFRGRPGPAVSAHPVADALVGLAVSLAGAALHEFGHAVALAHYGRRARRAGCGFYWGAISFYVDSTEALTLPRRARVTQALAGLAVDVVTLSLLAIVAQASVSVLLTAVAWRLALTGLFELVVNAAPVLQVDGHWALSDLLDEPDLGPRARSALGEAVRGRRRPDAFAWYGALSVLCGLGLLAMSGFVFWYAARDLLHALFTGDAADLAVGALLVLPVAAGLVFSTAGLLLEAIATEPGMDPHAGLNGGDAQRASHSR